MTATQKAIRRAVMLWLLWASVAGIALVIG
jgi:hypothetical protein